MSKNNDAIVCAAEKGYTTDGLGEIVSPSGLVLKQNILTTKCGYQSREFGIRHGKNAQNVPSARFIAYLKYGTSIFAPGTEVRHLNGNSLDNSWDNIAIGTPSENQMDKSPELRLRVARTAAASLRSLSEEEVGSLRRDREAGARYKELMVKYKLAKSTVSYIINRKTYA